VLAHQGGWDEILLVLGPILVIAGLLRLAKQRVDADRLAPKPNGVHDDGVHDDGVHDGPSGDDR
jgi:hypothetical protein